MAGIFLVMRYLFWALRYNGLLGFIKHIFGVEMETSKRVYVPLLVLLFLFIGAMESLSVAFARPVALAIAALKRRNNAFAGESILAHDF